MNFIFNYEFCEINMNLKHFKIYLMMCSRVDYYLL